MAWSPYTCSGVTPVLVSSTDSCRVFLAEMDDGQRGGSPPHTSGVGHSRTYIPLLGASFSPSSEDEQEVSPACVASTSQSKEPDDAFCSSVVQKILPALVQALSSEKVRQAPDSFLADDDCSDDNVDSVPLERSCDAVGGVSSPVGLQASQSASRVPVTTSHSVSEDFLGFSVASDPHVSVGHSLGAAFDVDEADGPPVTEALAKDIRSFLRMIPDDKKARLLADQWSIPCNIRELKTPESDANILSTLDHQRRRMESKLAQTNSLLGKALIPLIRFLDKHANSQDPSLVASYKDINASLSMLLPVFNYLNLMRRDILTDVLKAKSLQRTVKDKHMTGDKLFEANIVDLVKQFKESQRHINPKRFKVKRNNQNFAFRKGGYPQGFPRGSGPYPYRGSTHRGRGGRGRGQSGAK